MGSDLRQFLGEIDDILLRVRRPVDLDYLSALIADAEQPILFEALVGYPGWQLCDLLFRNRACQARVLKTNPAQVLPELGRRLSLPPRRPAVVAGGPVKAQVVTGPAVDLRGLPAFQHGAHDGARTIIAMTVCRDPDTGHLNLAFTRMTPLTATRATYFIGSSSHMRSVLEKHEQRDMRMPFAFVIGTHPAYEIMASYAVPTHLERFGELELVPNLLGEDIALARCETVPLEVPADAEVVIEGYVLPHVREAEGPGPSQFLYYHPGVTQQPVFEATALSRRADPIFRQHDTILYSDHQPLISLPHEAILYERLRELGLRIHDVAFVPWGGTLCCALKLTPEYDGQVRDALMFVLGSRWPNAKMAVAVDDDADLEDPRDLLWSLATRVDPQRDVFIVPDARGHRGDPCARPVEGGPGGVTVGKWGIDATKPPRSRPADRERFLRALPKHWGVVRLGAFLRGGP